MISKKMLFLRVFLRTLGILFAISTFVILISLGISFLPDQDKNTFRFVEGSKTSKNVIATLSINGPILNNYNNFFSKNIYSYIDPDEVKLNLENLKNFNPDVLVIKINSPGGTVSATNELQQVINNYKKENKTKIIFFTQEVLASGAYWVATTGDKIFAKYGSIIGSIGVSGPKWFYYNKPTSISSGIFDQSIETEKGIEVFSQTAGNSKDLYNPFRKPSINEITHLNSIVEDIYDDFVNLVSKSRKIEINTIKNDIGALIFNTKQAKEFYLIDGTINYNKLIKEISNIYNFEDYKLIEKDITKNILKKYFVNFVMRNNMSDICNQLHYAPTVILQNYLVSC